MEKPKIEIRKSTRAKYMSLSVGSDMTVVLTVPLFFDPEKARRFLESKTGWLTKKLALFKKRFPEGTVVLKSTRSEFLGEQWNIRLSARRPMKNSSPTKLSI
jgi:predicted metal-dependent hydrolase